MRRPLVPWLCAVLVLAADRLTKLLVIRHIEVGELIPISPGLSLSYVRNRGIAFSLLAESGWLSRVALHAVIVGAVVIIGWLLVRHGHRGLLAGASLGLILGGAVGNLVDRVLYGWVVDFIHVWIRLGDSVHSWPDFNVADSAITTGALLLILGELRPRGSRDIGAPGAD